MLRFLILLANILSLASIANSQQTSSVPQRVLAASFLAGSPDDAGRLMGARKCGFSPCTAEDGMLAMDIGRISPGLVKLMSGTSENREHRISWDVPTGASRCPSWVVCHERRMDCAARNCTRDEGGPFGFGDQEPISSHRKLLRAKAVVVSVAETPGQRFRQAWSREASASEPLQKCRKRISRCQNRGVTLPPGSARGMP